MSTRQRRGNAPASPILSEMPAPSGTGDVHRPAGLLIPRLLFLTLLLSAWLAAPTFACAQRQQDVVWSGLVFATNTEHPTPVPRELSYFGHKLKSVFGYNQLQLLSEHREIMDEQCERWLLPGKEFCLSISTRKESNHEYLLGLHLYQQKRLLVQTQARLARRSPIFFRGPLCEDGQLIIVLVVE